MRSMGTIKPQTRSCHETPRPRSRNWSLATQFACRTTSFCRAVHDSISGRRLFSRAARARFPGLDYFPRARGILVFDYSAGKNQKHHFKTWQIPRAALREIVSVPESRARRSRNSCRPKMESCVVLETVHVLKPGRAYSLGRGVGFGG